METASLKIYVRGWVRTADRFYERGLIHGGRSEDREVTSRTGVFGNDSSLGWLPKFKRSGLSGLALRHLKFVPSFFT